MKTQNKKLIFLIASIAFSFPFVKAAFAQVGYSNFREGDLAYIDSYPGYVGHIGILYRKSGRWWVRESRFQDGGVVSRPFISFYERYAREGNIVRLLRVTSCSDAEARQASEWAKSASGPYWFGPWFSDWPDEPAGMYCCSSFVWSAYYYALSIDLRPSYKQYSNPGNLWPSDIEASARTEYRGWIDILRLGDITGNGTISAADASYAARHAVGLVGLTYEQIEAADVTGNGTISAYDAGLIARRAVGLITKFPIEDIKHD